MKVVAYLLVEVVVIDLGGIRESQDNLVDELLQTVVLHVVRFLKDVPSRVGLLLELSGFLLFFLLR